jgi:hypothetical protein
MVSSSKSQPNKAQHSKGKFADVTFVTLTLDKKQKAEIKAQVWGLEEFDTAVLRLAELGYKVSMQEDTYNKCFACFITQRLPEGDNFGYILTGRGSTPSKAVKQAVFIGFHLLDGKFENFNPDQRGEDLDD